jgi:hypothetical protein
LSVSGNALDTIRPTNAVADVLGDADVGEQGELLEHHADPALLGRDEDAVAGDDPIPDFDRPGLHLLEAGNGSERRRLSATRGAEEGDEAAGGNIEGEAVERRDVTERNAEVPG